MTVSVIGLVISVKKTVREEVELPRSFNSSRNAREVIFRNSDFRAV